MKLYHGGIIPVESPRILSPDRIGDFGLGFYTTSSREQAKRFVHIKADRENKTGGFISIFEIQDEFLENPMLQTKFFESADEEWVDFVMKNRRIVDFKHSFDIVRGPVANDQVYASLVLYESDLISKRELLERLKARRLVDQILFHTAKSLLVLNYLGSEEVSCRK